jgi:hypothetical protein
MVGATTGGGQINMNGWEYSLLVGGCLLGMVAHSAQAQPSTPQAQKVKDKASPKLYEREKPAPQVAPTPIKQEQQKPQ